VEENKQRHLKKVKCSDKGMYMRVSWVNSGDKS